MAAAVQITGNQAVAEAARLARIELLSACSSVPPLPLAALLAGAIDRGTLPCRFHASESDRAAVAAAAGASLSGARALTTLCFETISSAYEPLRFASGLRLPVVAVVAHGQTAGQGESAAQESAGWLQFQCESNQELLDTLLQAFKIAEDPRVLLPVLVSCEGFLPGDARQPVVLPAQEEADAFLPRYDRSILDLERPASIGLCSSQQLYTEYQFQQHRAMDSALEVVEAVSAGYARQFGRDWGGALEPYMAEGADLLLLSMGSLAATFRRAVDELRSGGTRVGLLKIRSLRPFPSREVLKWVTGARAVAVADRSVVYGAGGALYRELLATLAAGGISKPVVGFVAGLGGRDVTPGDVESMVERTLSAAAAGRTGGEVVWLNLKIDLVRGEALSWR